MSLTIILRGVWARLCARFRADPPELGTRATLPVEYRARGRRIAQAMGWDQTDGEDDFR